ncbi:hypothetical protein LINPERHAP1_LOCUS24837 [Linum perenne]
MASLHYDLRRCPPKVRQKEMPLALNLFLSAINANYHPNLSMAYGAASPKSRSSPFSGLEI